MQKNIISLLVLYVVILSLSGCGKMDATYVDFIKDGKIIYPGKADSLKVYPGKYRIQLSWLLIDPNVTNTVIYWDNRADSVEVAVGSPGRVQDAQVMLIDMDEGTYFFEFYTFDDERNKSVKVEVTGQVYGDLYSSSLLTIPIQKVTSNADSTVIVWEASEDGDFIGIELEYTNKEGEIKHLFSNIDDGTITIRDLKLGTNFRYRSLFLPSPLALDTFYSDYTERFIEPARVIYPNGTWSIAGLSSE